MRDMDNELQQLLRSILKEELTPINERLGTIEKVTAGMKADIGQLKQDTAVMKKDIIRLKQDTQQLKGDTKQLKVDMVEIKLGQEKLQKNIIENLGEYTEKMIEHNDNKAEVLNKRVFKLEAEMERVTKQ